MNYNYIIIFDETQPQFNKNVIHNFVVNSPYISDWWHHISNVYIVTTQLTAKKMADSIIASFPGLRFFITRVDLSDYNGVLTQNAWEWIKRKTNALFDLLLAPKTPTLPIDELLKRTYDLRSKPILPSQDMMKRLKELLGKK